jgi:hypothetical protein
LNGINSLLNNMKIYQAVQKLLVGACTHTHTNTHTNTHTHTDRQTGDLISLLSFLESRLKGKTQTNKSHAHAHTMSSCTQNIVLFNEKGDNFSLLSKNKSRLISS